MTELSWVCCYCLFVFKECLTIEKSFEDIFLDFNHKNISTNAFVIPKCHSPQFGVEIK